MKKIICFLALSFSLCASVDEYALQRDDGSLAQVYSSIPEDAKAIVVLIPNAYDQSVFNDFNTLQNLLAIPKIGCVIIEPRGITKTMYNESEHLESTLDHQVQDYCMLLDHLDVPCVLCGTHDGGKAIPRIALAHPENVQGAIFIASGGGVPYIEEVRHRVVNSSSALEKWCVSSLLYFFPHLIEQPSEATPEDQEHTPIGPRSQTVLDSFQNYQPLPDLLELNIPLLMLHGTEDQTIPVQSSDLIHEAFKQAGKTNLTYERHSRNINNMANLFKIVDWIKAQSTD